MSDSNVLGQRRRATNIDRTLADKLNAEAETEKSKQALEEKLKPASEASEHNGEPALPGNKDHGYNLDEKSADHRAILTPGEWSSYWSTINDGRVMMSASDLYEIGLLMEPRIKSGPQDFRAHAKDMIRSLRKDFRSPQLILNTQVQYKPGKQLEGTISQHYNSSNPAIKKDTPVIIPVYENRKIEDVLNEENGLHFIRALFNTPFGADDIMKNLELVFDTKRGRISVFTMDYGHRDYWGVVSIASKYITKGVSINCDAEYKQGHSRGVHIY